MSAPVVGTRPVLLVALAAGLTACSGNPNALDPRGEGAARIAGLWWLMFWLGTAVFVLVLVVLAVAVVGSRRRRRGRAEPDDPTLAPPPEGERSAHRLVVGLGIVMPLVILLPVMVHTFRVGADLSPVHEGGTDLTIEVIGHQFWWEIRYPDHGVVTANEVHIPVGQPVELQMTSRDVIHSFWVPNLHGKIDLIPGEDTHLHLHAHEPGEYWGICAEFCGVQHALMRILVVAHEPGDFEDWMAARAQAPPTPADPAAREGAELFLELGCAACHRVAGTPAEGTRGPDLSDLAVRRTLGAGAIENNRANLGGWVADPQALKPGNLMPPTPMSGEQLQALLAYLETLE